MSAGCAGEALEWLERSEIEQVALFAEVEPWRLAELGVGAGGFVDVAAEEAGGLYLIEEGADGGRAEVQAIAGTVERRVLGGAMAHQD